MGDEQTDTKLEADAGGKRASENPRAMPHYTSIIHPLVAADFRQNPTVVTAWSYSDINRLYNAEIGEWSGIRFCESNMVPFWTNFTAVQGTPGTSGSLGTASYFIIVTGQDTQNQYESYIASVSNSISVTGPNGSISVTTPNVAGYSFNVYVGTTSSPANLGLSASGPTVGPLQGQATQLPANTTVTITGLGVAQTPPASPGSGLTVYPTYVIGRGSYAQVVLDNVKFSYLKDADKSDPLNQLRVVCYKLYYGSLLENVQFFARIESVSANTATFG